MSSCLFCACVCDTERKNPTPFHLPIHTHSIQRSLSAVQTMTGGTTTPLGSNAGGDIGVGMGAGGDTIARSLSNLPPLSELPPSGACVFFLYACGYVYDPKPETNISYTYQYNTAQAARGAWAVVKARDSSWRDRFAAAKVLLFLTFEDPTSRSVCLSVVFWGC
jgi:hypothetical protein